MKRNACAIAIIILLTLAFPAESNAFESASRASALKADAAMLKSDYNHFYLNTENLLMLGAGLVASGAIANTRLDREVKDYYQVNIRNNFTNRLSEATKLPGDFYIAIPALLATRLFYPETIAGEWAGRSLRAFFTGGPMGLFLQYSTGASRPREGDSDWRPFSGNNGLSGHAFIGAIPFITAANMTDNPYQKALFYGLSAMPALSRINDDEHYASQALLGWYLAYLSTNAVKKTGFKKDIAFRVIPVTSDGYAMVVVTGLY
ncbi:MAG: phosphatase PAP2 family protein [Deltaproteobacteria bacterium]